MDVSDDKKDDSDGLVGVHDCAGSHSLSSRVRFYCCTAAGCKHRLSIKNKHKIDNKRVCDSCWHRNRHSSTHVSLLSFSSSSSSTVSPPSSSTPSVPTEQPSHSNLTQERRWAIIHYFQLGLTVRAISLHVGCSPTTAYHWINHWKENKTVDSLPRSGRPRLPLPPLKDEATAHPFDSTPKLLKAKLKLPVSRRTIRRRLNDDLLFGRISRHFFILSADTIRSRLSFANGYMNWTVEQWMKVLFSDEKIFTLGHHGRVWVQRPINSAWDKKYCREVESHPKGVNFWCCFSGLGTGGCETFEYNNNGAVMRGILQYHLLNSARKFYTQKPPELWWLLWDNSPIHKSLEVKTWLHNNGVNCMDLPPYSPDLNPTENLFADLARRVEQRYPQNVDELEQAIHEEWTLTNTSFLSQLARSMPHRIKAILDNQGHATKY